MNEPVRPLEVAPGSHAHHHPALTPQISTKQAIIRSSLLSRERLVEARLYRERAHAADVLAQDDALDQMTALIELSSRRVHLAASTTNPTRP